MSYGGRSGSISSMTNDPETAYMRVFVGNINTNTVSKQLLSRVFSKYGYVTAISIHRGFAFVQFNNYHCARAAARGENGNMIGDQYADCNLAAEPKPNQKPPDSMGGGYEGYGEYEESWDESSYDDSYDFGLQQGWGVSRPGSRGRSRGRGFGGVQSGRVGKAGKGKPMSSLTKAALGKSLMTMKDLNIDSIKSDLIQIRDRVNILIETLDKALAKEEENKPEEEAAQEVVNEEMHQQQADQDPTQQKEDASGDTPVVTEVVPQEEYAMTS